MVLGVKSAGLAGALLLSVSMMPDRALDAIGVRAIAQERKSETPRIAPLCNLPPQFTLTGHLSPVNALAVSADSKTLVSGDGNGTLNVWSLETGQLLHSLAAYPGAVKAIAITPDGKSIVSANPLEERYQRDDIAIKVWNLKTGELIQSLIKHQGTVQTLESPDAQTVIRVSETSDENFYEVKIEFLNRGNGGIIQTSAPTVNQSQHTERDSLSTQDSSKKIAAFVNVRGLDRDISFIALQNLTVQKSLCTLPSPGEVQNIIFSPDNQKLIIASQKIEVIALNPAPVKPDQSELRSTIQHLNRLGLDKLKRKQYYSAARHFWQVFELNRQLADEQGQIDAIFNIAEAKYALCQVGWNSCRTDYQGLYELLLPYFEAKGNRIRAAITLQRNKPHERVRDNKKEDYQQVLRKYRTIGDRKAEADTLVKIALIDRYQSDRESLLKQALKLYREVGDRKGELEVLYALGLSYSRVIRDKNYKPIGFRTFEAITHLEAAAKLSRESEIAS